MVQEDPLVVHASPTKEFFITILIRDIKLIDAICDLIDNAVDGARRLCPTAKLNDLFIEIDASKESLIISDNCGGIEVSVARDYAFRFGRTKETPNSPHSIGRFGVGMKRAFFKIGSKIDIESIAETSRFKMNIDVNKWISPDNKDKDGREQWDFSFAECQENITNPVKNRQTIVSITSLHPTISAEFSAPTFKNKLIAAIESAHSKAIESGLRIRVGETDLSLRQISLLNSDSIKPQFTTTLYQKEKTVTVRIYAGISDQVLSDCGWYVFCNDRLILQADRSQLTGWDSENGDIEIPRAHYQFARFRGYVFFDSDDAGELPWNTMKNGVDEESSIYQATRLHMINAMRPIIDFLNSVDNELQADTSPLKTIVDNAKPIQLKDVEQRQTFLGPTASQIQQTAPKEGRISYTTANEKLARAKELLNVTSNKAVGEATFYYFLRANGDE
ncbi:MAG: hypothetical protein C0406_05485 [Sideroxydans sp.]|nr:hypothetical protein [Sideroxydans sp.]